MKKNLKSLVMVSVLSATMLTAVGCDSKEVEDVQLSSTFESTEEKYTSTNNHDLMIEIFNDCEVSEYCEIEVISGEGDDEIEYHTIHIVPKNTDKIEMFKECRSNSKYKNLFLGYTNVLKANIDKDEEIDIDVYFNIGKEGFVYTVDYTIMNGVTDYEESDLFKLRTEEELDVLQYALELEYAYNKKFANDDLTFDTTFLNLDGEKSISFHITTSNSGYSLDNLYLIQQGLSESLAKYGYNKEGVLVTLKDTNINKDIGWITPDGKIVDNR